MSHQFLRAASLSAMMILSLTAAAPAIAEQKIVVGQVVDLFGVNGDTARDYIAGAKVYFDYVNANGGVNGMKIEHTYRDDGGDPAKAVELTREYIEKDKVDVMFGKDFGNSLLLAVKNLIIILNEVGHAEYILAIPGILQGTVSELFVHSRIEVANQEM